MLESWSAWGKAPHLRWPEVKKCYASSRGPRRKLSFPYTQHFVTQMCPEHSLLLDKKFILSLRTPAGLDFFHVLMLTYMVYYLPSNLIFFVPLTLFNAMYSVTLFFYCGTNTYNLTFTVLTVCKCAVRQRSCVHVVTPQISRTSLLIKGKLYTH